MHEMDAVRATRPWAFTERYRLAQGVKRRLARIIHGISPVRNLVMYSPSDMIWEIVG
jgi:hypothetical protein